MPWIILGIIAFILVTKGNSLDPEVKGILTGVVKVGLWAIGVLGALILFLIIMGGQHYVR